MKEGLVRFIHTLFDISTFLLPFMIIGYIVFKIKKYKKIQDIDKKLEILEKKIEMIESKIIES